jgi:hypothetical protein
VEPDPIYEEQHHRVECDILHPETLPRWRPTKRIQPTPLCGPKIVAFLEVGFSPIVVPTYQAAWLMREALGCQSAKNKFTPHRFYVIVSKIIVLAEKICRPFPILSKREL